jgi:hypothetical protein
MGRKKMEKALFIGGISDLNDVDVKKFDRLYFGAEFCEKLLPNADEINVVAKFCSDNKMGFSLVTPWCTEKGVETLKIILKELPLKAEIIFNDWGIFKMLDKKKFNPVAGRMIVSIKRDPRFPLGFKKGVAPDQLSNLDNKTFQEFLFKLGVFRVELDNVAQGYSFELSHGISTSLYYPNIYISTSRKCLFANERNFIKGRRLEVGHCNFECNDYVLSASLPKCQRKIIIQGNSQFYTNNKMPDDFKKFNIDRLVLLSSFAGGGNC